MRLRYEPDGDTLMIHLREVERYQDSDEVAPGVIVHLDTNGEPAGIEILNALQRGIDVSGIRLERGDPAPTPSQA